MAVTPSAQYSVTIRVEIKAQPTDLLGRLTTAIGGVGGDIGAVDLVGAGHDSVTRELVVNASDLEHAERIVAAAGTVEGVTVVSHYDRTFAMHRGGKIQMTPTVPLENRDDLSVAYMPGVNTSGETSINGSIGRAKEVLIDGASTTIPESGGVVWYFPGFEAFQEFKLVTSSFNAEHGRLGGGLEVMVSKSGTNEFHGVAFNYHQNSAMNAKNVFFTEAKIPKYIQNQYGGTLGGPIVKNKLFTFTSWEQWRKREPRTNFMTMPTELERTGDFSRSLNADGGLRTIYDPWSTRLENGRYIRTPFSNNVIPTNRLDPTSVKMMQDIWGPNNAGDDVTGVNNFKETWLFSLKYWNFSNRTDWNINDKWRVFGRYSQFHNTIDELHTVKTRALTGWDGGAMYAFNVAGDSVYVLSPSTVFNVAGSYGSIHDDYYAPNVEIQESDLNAFWPSGWYQPYIKDLPQIYYPALNIGDASIGHGFYWIEHPKNASIRGKVTHIRGKHDMKFGVHYRKHFGYVQYPDLMDFNFNSALTAETFVQPNTCLNGSPWATFLVGALDGNSQAQYIAPHELNIAS